MPVEATHPPLGARPDIASSQDQRTLGVLMYQPLSPSGVGGLRNPRIVGAVASRLIVTDLLTLPESFVAVQVNVTPIVSWVTVSVSQPFVGVPSVTIQLTVTSLVYHPLFPSVPVTTGWTLGGD